MRLGYPQLRSAALLAVLSGPLLSASQKLPAAPPPGSGIALGDSAVLLNGPWKFSPGDSPWTMNPAADTPELLIKSPLWAQPGFDDSTWTTIGLAPPASSPIGLAGPASSAAAETRIGFPSLLGFAWARLSLRVADPSQRLWLQIPGSFEAAYEVYANGQYVGQFGEFTMAGVTAYQSQPASFALPQLPPDGRLELALRLYTPASPPDAGSPHGPPILGAASTVQLLLDADRDALFQGYFGDYLVVLLFLLALPLALWALRKNPHQFVWLWLAVALGVQVIATLLGIASGLSTAISAASASLWIDTLFTPIGFLFWIYFWWSWFEAGRPDWIPTAASALAAAQIGFCFAAISPVLGLHFVSTANAQWFGALAIAVVAVQSILLILMLSEGFRPDEPESILAALSIGLLILANLTHDLSAFFAVSFVFRVFGLGFSATDVAQILMISAIVALAARRFLQTSVSQGLTDRILEQELDLAGELQQRVLVPENLHSPHFQVEAEYRAAKIVGGDFLVTMVGRDGSLCVVIGDVSGRGIGAALLVAVLVGAARTRAAQDFDPITMLQALDERLSGRSGGHFATCLAAQLFPNGVLRLANAGHIPPYLNGCELDLEGSLPIGIPGQLGPAKKQFQLRKDDVLTFITDGVIEAKNSEGELFGFERARVFSQRPPEDLIDEVQAFGQSDDITVVRVSFIRSEPIGPSANLAASQVVQT